MFSSELSYQEETSKLSKQEVVGVQKTKTEDWEALRLFLQVNSR